ncbi:MAG: hypothetical protein KA243_02245 [Candidatus Aminicenantes bacterium]|nr:hypothetical protein [Candidatus Aminicenantes bacterium]
MPKKTKSTKGEGKAPQGKGNGNGRQKAGGRAKEAKPAGAWARFKGDFRPGTEVRSKNPKLQAFKTYGKLRDHLAEAVGEGKGLKEIAAGLGVTPARVNELVHILGVVGEKCVDRPTVGPGGELVMEAPRERKGKKA